MSDLTPFEYDGQLVVDSRLIAEELGIKHESFMETIENYKTQAEREFGVFRFETGKPSEGSKGGRPQNYYLLTEDQATFLMTLSRNTPEVVQCKIKLVKAFSTSKELFRRKNLESFNPYTLGRVAVHHSSFDNPLPDGYFSCFDKTIEILQRLDVKLGYQLEEQWYDKSGDKERYLEPDISMGSIFSKLFTSNFSDLNFKYQEEFNSRFINSRIKKDKFWSKKLIDMKWAADRAFAEQNVRQKYLASHLPLSESEIDRVYYTFCPSPSSGRPETLPNGDPYSAYAYSNDYSSLFYGWLRDVFFKFRWRDYILTRDQDGWIRRYNAFYALPQNERDAILKTSEGGLILGFDFYDTWNRQLPPGK